MAQLPPKIPNWPDFNNAANTHTSCQNSLWVDDFIDFSAARRMTHRRSVSDPITFVEEHSLPDHKHEFERFDDEQFINMFTDDNVYPSLDPSNPSTSSDNNSLEGDKESVPCEQKEEEMQQGQLMKKDSEEVQSQFKTGETGTSQAANAKSLDPKRVKRILANRQSAQRSRVRKLHYISELERSVTTLQAEVSMLTPRVAFLDQQRLLLNVDNSALKQRIAALAQDKIFKDATHEALTREIERLRELYHQQQKNLQKMESPVPSPRPSNSNVGASLEAQQLLNI